MGGIAGAIIGGSAAKSAARAQVSAAKAGQKVQKEIYQQTRSDLKPYMQSGQVANQAANFLLGIGDAPIVGAQPLEVTAYGRGGNALDFGSNKARYWMAGDQRFNDEASANAYAKANGAQGQAYSFQNSPGFQTQLDTGLVSIDNSAASAGNLFSGATMKAAQEYGTGLAQQDYWNQYNALAGMSSAGQNAAAQAGNAGQNYANGMTQGYNAIGNAKAAGTMGMANALTGGISNAIGGYQQYNALSGLAGSSSPLSGLASGAISGGLLGFL